MSEVECTDGSAIIENQMSPAQWAYERLVRSIIAFEEKLEDDKEVGASLVSFNRSSTFHIENIGYWGPDLVIFYGRDENEQPIELIQHIAQINVLLVGLPIEKEQKTPRRIGFQLGKKLQQDLEEHRKSGQDLT